LASGLTDQHRTNEAKKSRRMTGGKLTWEDVNPNH